MYYLNSRFFDPAISRFINADSGISGNEEELLGYNMFTYCFNNPVNLDDSEGNWPSIRSIVRKAVAVVKTVIRHVENFQNKKKIKKEIQNSYTKAEAKNAINGILNKYSRDQEKCEVNFDVGPGVEISNSCRVDSKYDRQKICMIIKNTNVTERSSGNMAAEWMFHNIAKDYTEPYESNPYVKGVYSSAISANIDYGRDIRNYVVIISKILEIWGVE